MLDRLGRADRTTAGGALLAVVGTLLPWYHFDDGPSRVTTNGFGSGFLGDVTFLAAVGLLLLVLVRTGVIALEHSPDSPQLELGLAAAGLAAVLLQILVGVNGSGAFHHATVGVAVALAATVAMAVGVWLHRGEAASATARQGHASR